MAVVGLLHPGEMGASVGGALVDQAVRVVWASERRSTTTKQRADAVGLDDVGTLDRLVSESDVILSICPPHAALDVAQAAADSGFAGIYVDANAVSPGTARAIGAIVQEPGARFVDGDLIGGPARPGGHTRLYLSGPESSAVAALFRPGDRIDVVELGGDLTAASALKMCYAAWTKGTAGLLLAVRALARDAGVEEALVAEWRRTQPELLERFRAAQGVVPKAWRFAGEMDEIALAFSDAKVPGAGFPAAIAQVFGTLASFKDIAADEDAILTALHTWRNPRPGGERKADVLAKLAARHADAWVATSAADGDHCLVPLSYAWDGERLILATPPSTPTARNLQASGKARVALGATRDVALIDVVLEEAIDIQAASSSLTEVYAVQADWDPRLVGGSFVYLVLRPRRIQAWRQANEIDGRTLMRDGIWLV